MRVSFTISRTLLCLGICIATSGYFWFGHDGIATVVVSATTAGFHVIRSIPHQFRLVSSPSTQRSRVSICASDIYSTIINKPGELHDRWLYFLRHLPAAIEDQSAYMIDVWRNLRNPKMTGGEYGLPVYFLEFRGLRDDGTEKYEVTYLDNVITEPTYVTEPLTVSTAMQYVYRAIQPKVQAVLDAAFVVCGTTIYATLYAIIDFNQRWQRAGAYAAFFFYDWWIEDFAVSVFLKSVMTDVPQAYRTSYNDICDFIALLFPYAVSAFETGYPLVSSVLSSTPKIIQSIVRYGLRAFSYARCEQNPDHIICVQNDDWVVLVAALLSLGFLRFAYNYLQHCARRDYGYSFTAIKYLCIFSIRIANFAFRIIRWIIYDFFIPERLGDESNQDRRMSMIRCVLDDLIGVPILILYLLDSPDPRDRQDLVNSFCGKRRPEAIRHLAASIYACWNALHSENLSKNHTMPGGVEDFMDDVEELSLPWWYRFIAFTRFCTSLLLHLLGMVTTRLLSTFKWLRLTFNKHFEFRPIDIIGIALFALVAHIFRIWRPYLSPAHIGRKIAIRTPGIRLPSIPIGHWIRQTSTIQQDPLQHQARWRLAQYAETNTGAGTCIMTGLCAIIAFSAIVYWLVEGRCRNVTVAEIEHYGANEDEADIDDLL